MTETVVIMRGTEEYDALRSLTGQGENVTLEIVPSWSEKRFERGDKVEVPFDAGWGPAVVDSFDGKYVRVRYGPAGRPNDLKYSTSLDPGSVRTNNRVQHPAIVKVVV